MPRGSAQFLTAVITADYKYMD